MLTPLYVFGQGLDNTAGGASINFRGLPTDVSAFTFSFGRPSINITYGTLNASLNIFPNISDALDYYFTSEAAAIVAQANTDASATSYPGFTLAGRAYDDSGFGQGQLDLKVNNSDLQEKAQDAIGAALSPDFVYDDVGNMIALRQPADGYPTTLSQLTTATRLSTTRRARVNYSLKAALSITLLAGQSVTAILEHADDSGFTTNVVTEDTADAANSGLLGLSQTQQLKLIGEIPANKYRRVRLVNNVGSPTTTFGAAKESLL